METPNGADATTEVVAVPVRPVEPAGVPMRGGAARWAIALATVVIVGVLSVAGVALVAGGGSASALAAWAPADSDAYAEARTDLPGDQQRNVGSLLAHFPGFSDQATLDQKTDEALAGVVRQLTNGSVDYARDLKPWLGGEIAVAVGSLDTVVVDGSDESVTGGSVVVLATAKDPAAAQTFLNARLPGTEPPVEHGGATLTVTTLADRQVAWTVTGTTALLGDVAAVEAALDAKADGGLAATDDFSAAVAQVPADRVALAWADSRAVATAAGRLSVDTLDATQAARMPDPATLPAWIVAALRAETTGMVLDVVTPRPSKVDAGTARVSAVAEHLPASTIASLEVHDVGAVLERSLRAAIADPALKDQLGQLGPLVDGSLGSFLDWAGDGAIVATSRSGRTSGGVVALATDGTVAEQRLAAIRAILAFVDLPGGVRPVVTEVPYGDGTIVTVDLGDAATLLEAATKGQGAGGSGASGALDPSMLESVFPSGRVTIVYTVQRGVFVAGTDVAFVKEVVDTTPATSLASVPAYRTAIGLVGAKNDGEAFVDVSAAVGLAKSIAGAALTDMGQVDPFLVPLDAVGVSYTATTDVVRLRLALTVTER
jgi:hypothetical protein